MHTRCCGVKMGVSRRSCGRASARRVVAVVASIALASLAGCTIGAGQDGSPPDDRPTLGETVITGDSGDDGDIVLPAGLGDSAVTLSFEASPAFCCSPLAIDFIVIAPETSLPPGTLAQWDFGDGRTGTGLTTHHTYLWPGDYLVSLTVERPDGTTQGVRQLLSLIVDGDSDSGVVNVVVSGPVVDPESGPGADPVSVATQEPVANAGPDQVVYAGDVVTLDGNATTSSPFQAVRFTWIQVSGTRVVLESAGRLVVTFTAPGITDDAEQLVFELAVTQGEEVSSDTMTVTVMPLGADIDMVADGDIPLPDDPDVPPVGDDYNLDADGDGLPDAWEVRYFDTIAQQGAGGDPDGDSLDNSTEYRDRTDPTRADVHQLILNQLDRAIRSFWGSGGRFEHAVDGTLVGWPIVKTVDETDPPSWCVDDKICANQPVVSMMGPGIPHVGLAFMRAYERTGNKLFLEYALEAARTLLSVQHDLETNPDGSLRPPLCRGGWINYAAVVPDNADTRADLPDEIGHWTTLRTVGDEGDLAFVPRGRSYMTFDDSISTGPAMFLLELYATVKDLDFSRELVDPLTGFDKAVLLDGAVKVFSLAERYRTDFQIRREDFEDLYFEHQGGNPEKNGPHPFLAYLENLPEHPLNHGQPFRPYVNGGLPHGIGEVSELIAADGAKYGALAAGHPLHKYVNDHVMARHVLFVVRYLQITGDQAALDSLQLQLDWLVDVFQADGSRAWCQQYHVLDDTCAPSRPFEPPAFAMMETRGQIRRVGFVEKLLEEQYGVFRDDVRRMLEDATYYIDRVIERDEPGLLFQYYAVDGYDQSGYPTGHPAIEPDDPVFTCDYYYPDDPYDPCVSPYDELAYHYYLIDEASNGEFVAPNGFTWLSDVGDGYIPPYMIDDTCAHAPAAADYRGCLDLNKINAIEQDYWIMDKQYWGFWDVIREEDYFDGEAPDENGLWTSSRDIRGRTRTVIGTGDFANNVVAIANFMRDNPDGIVDADSDGLTDADEVGFGTDARYPDTDTDGLRDGDEVILYATDPGNPDSDGDGWTDGEEVEAGSDPTLPARHP